MMKTGASVGNLVAECSDIDSAHEVRFADVSLAMVGVLPGT